MALAQNPLSSEDASGSVGRELTFYHQGLTRCVRVWRPTPNPRSAAQVTARQAFQRVRSSWADLTAAQVEAWDDFARANPEEGRFGNVILTGQQCFVRANLPQERWQTQIFVNEPPTWPRHSYCTEFSCGCGPSSQSYVIWTIPDWVDPLDLMVMWSQGPYSTTARALREGHQRIITAGPVSSLLLRAPVGVEGEWYWIGIEYHRIGWGSIGRGWMWGVVRDQISWDSPIKWDRR